MKNTLTLSLFLCFFSISTAFSQNRIGTGQITETYQMLCASCHGDNLQGGLGASLIDDEWLHGSTDAHLAKVIAEGILDKGMIPYKHVLSDEQIRSLVIFIREKKQLAAHGELIQQLTPVNGVFKSDHHSFKLEKMVQGKGIIFAMDAFPNGDLIYTERQGDLYVLRDNEPILITGTPDVWQHGQGGLMEVGVHPEYEQNGWIYLGFSENTGGVENDKTAGMTAVVRGKIVDNQWVNQEELFHVPPSLHSSAGVHFGTRFVFRNGYLYFSIGDRGRRPLAQELSKPNGKIHRIWDDGRIPEDNPFSAIKDSYPTVWSYGHRNPQGMDLDPQTGLIWSTEHGPRGGDECNLIKQGQNYGWPEITYGMNYDGSPITHKTSQDGMEQPKINWTPSIAACGIDFYEGTVFPEWTGQLFATGLASEELHRIRINEEKIVEREIVLKNQGRIRDVLSAPDGYLYVSLNSGSPRVGTIYRLVPVK